MAIAFYAATGLSLLVATAGAEDVSKVRALRLARLIALNQSGMQDSQVANAVLATRWPIDMQENVADVLNIAINNAIAANERLNATAVRFFVEINGSVPPGLVSYLEIALRDAELGDKFHLLSAVCSIDRHNSGLIDAVRESLDDSSYVIALRAAAALLCMENSDIRSLNVLRSHLRNQPAEVLWRAADAVGHSGVNNSIFVDRMKLLLQHSDVRVRVVAAVAIWKLTKDVDASVSVLREALRKEDVPLPFGFVSPSNPGESHRAYIAHALGNMRQQGADVLEDLISIVEDVGMRQSAVGAEWKLAVAMTALTAIAKSGPVSEVQMARIRASVKRRESVFHNYIAETEAILMEIERS